MKYLLLNNSDEFNSKESEMKTFLNIPDDAGTTGYALSSTVENSEHSDYGKFIFPVETSGKWKCDGQFDSSELVDFDSTWIDPASIPSE